VLFLNFAVIAPLVFLALYMRGLWKMRNWARILTIILHGGMIIIELLLFIQQLQAGMVAESLSVVGGILISVFIAVWFAVNGNKFG
jgi:hypothetical protein